MRTALLQVTSSDDPDENRAMLCARIREAALSGAGFVLTPEVCNCVSSSRSLQLEVLRTQDADPNLADIRDLAAGLGVWVLIGSLALKTSEPDGRFANRSFLIGPDGEIAGHYDKIHMFDVTISETESYRESAGYRPGDSLTMIRTPFGTVGMSICYDVRFPHIYRALAKSGAEILTVPSAFSPVTGAAHWEPLLRARAIETGCFVLAPAQTGQHSARRGAARKTYGHSLVVDPWGKVLVNAGEKADTVFVNLTLSEIGQARRKVPSLTHDRDFTGP